MKGGYDLIVIGAGPAGLAVAAQAAELGLSTVLVDEQGEPGGQIYRAIETVAGKRPGDLAMLGSDYRHGEGLVRAFRAAAVEYRPATTVWQVGADGAVGCSSDSGATLIYGSHIVVATGAMERPVPIPGWTLPGVMGVGGAQVLLKSAGVVPDGKIVLVGSGPLLLLGAAQLIKVGATVAAVVETTRWQDYLAAAPHLPRALRAFEYLKNGMALRTEIKRARVPIHSGARDLAAYGTDRVEGLRFRCGGAARDVAADTVLLHNGVVPDVQITRQLDCTHRWDPLQRYWRPAVDEWGRTSVAHVSVAGDGAGIFGAPAAEAAGRLTALNVAVLLGAIPAERRDSLAAPLRRERAHHLAVRPMLNRLFRPHREILAPPDDATLVCRCEEITVGAIRESVALGCLGPNQLKAFTRCGMGPCQGRMCGLTTAEVIAEARGISPAEVGYYRIRPPIKPLTLGELAALEIPTADPEP